ncbi:hypothetical protein ARMGADRAFT_1045619 [Armillaria gallica]|uniref:Uncharacterized protein n=1 Tax=Armillaria gallica TaxID=47427 RepID=A0A2H3DHS7_ARMGA|nr:hypothetical protein ARMGADRAFT_1045619 [Armillaria gallica]
MPCHHFGAFGCSLIDDEDFAQELNEPEVLMHLQQKKTISLATAQRWMKKMGYCWMQTPKGQYVDGHECENVLYYRNMVFLPKMALLQERTWKWITKHMELEMLDSLQCHMVLWFHNKSTFYAHDHHKLRWVHKKEKAVPLAKGEGVSLMVADFISADYGWLTSLDGKETACEYFKAGSGQDGYFDNEKIREQCAKVMNILEKHYPDEDHVFIYDNATTHCKHAESVLSTLKMTKNPSANFSVEVNLIGANEKPAWMANSTFGDTEQEFYYPDDYLGWFKGMVTILEERGISTTGKKAQCRKNFKSDCPKGAVDCHCRRILFNQPDFISVESVLEMEVKACGFDLLFLPKFHSMLGYAKRKYRMYPPSSKEADLEINVKKALATVDVVTMCRFTLHSLRFMDTYRKGLTGNQAAWATKKY